MFIIVQDQGNNIHQLRIESGDKKSSSNSGSNYTQSSQEVVRESLEKLKLQTLNTYTHLKDNQANIQDLRRVQEVFSVLNGVSTKEVKRYYQ